MTAAGNPHCLRGMRGCGATCFLVGVIGGGSFLGAAPLPSSVSPFLPPDAPAAVAGTAAQGAPVEFRGVVVMGGRQRFNFFDPARKQSVWIGLDEPGTPYRVTAYDDARESVTVEVEGRVLALTLEKTKIASSPPPGNVPMAGAVPAVAGAPAPGVPPVVLNPTAADEAKRLEAIAAEVRRRRALRQQGGAATPAPGGAATAVEKAN